MAGIEIDAPVSDFECPATGTRTVRLSELRGRKLVLYFYPRDNTPGCTTESQNFRDLTAAFEAADTLILGVSRDTLRSHENFKGKQCLPFDLLADRDEVLCELFDVMRTKKMYGREVRGIERSTFLLDANGVLRRQWRGVKVPGHAAEVLAAARAI